MKPTQAIDEVQTAAEADAKRCRSRIDAGRKITNCGARYIVEHRKKRVPRAFAKVSYMLRNAAICYPSHNLFSMAHLDVRSRHLVERVDSESFWLGYPVFADELVRGKTVERFQALGVVEGVDETRQVGLELSDRRSVRPYSGNSAATAVAGSWRSNMTLPLLLRKLNGVVPLMVRAARLAKLLIP